MSNLTGFAEACYNTNSIHELEYIVEQLKTKNVCSVADKIDCDTWDINPGEWAVAILDAYYKKVNDKFSGAIEC